MAVKEEDYIYLADVEEVKEETLKVSCKPVKVSSKRRLLP